MLKGVFGLYFALEMLLIVGLIAVYGLRGFGYYALEVIISGIIGMVILSKFGMQNLINNFGMFNLKSAFHEFSFVISGILFVLPGILSDIFAIILLIFYFFGKKNRANFTDNQTRPNHENSDIIDVEVIEDK